MKYFIKSVAFKTKFEFECELSAVMSSSTARLKIWYGLNKESWKENTIIISNDKLWQIIRVLNHADEFRLDQLPDRYSSIDNEINGRKQLYEKAYQYYKNEFLPIEKLFFK